MTVFAQVRPLLGVIILIVAVLAFALLEQSGAEVPEGERNLVYGAVLTALIYEGSGAVSSLRGRPNTPPAAGGTSPYDDQRTIGGEDPGDAPGG